MPLHAIDFSGIRAFTLIFLVTLCACLSQISLKLFTTKVSQLCLLFLLSSFAVSMYHATMKPFVFSLLSVVCFAYVFVMPARSIRIFVSFISVLLLGLLGAGIFSMMAYLGGLSPMGSFNYLGFYGGGYLYLESGIPRNAGLFLEPGQLSFYTCLAVACREFLGMQRAKSLLLLAAGFSTLSLAHLVFSFGYIISLFAVHGRRKDVLLSLVLRALFAVSGVALLVTPGGAWMIERLLGFVNDPESWQRFVSMTFVINKLDGSWVNLMFGPSSSLADRLFEPNELFNEGSGSNVSVYGENPLSPLIFGGLAASWPYYFIFIYGVSQVVSLKPNSIVLIAFLTLFIQRPYMLEFPYTFALALLFHCYWRYEPDRMRDV